jgi:methyl-accepting chemotaxis protein
MGSYKDIPANERRAIYNDTLKGVLLGHPSIVDIYSVWKPNALDGLDAQFAGTAGYTASGQYAIAFNRETGAVTVRSTSDVAGAMAHISGPYAKEGYCEGPFTRKLNGTDVLAIRLAEPVIDNSTQEVVGVVGVVISIVELQQMVLDVVKNNADISAMDICVENGRILASNYANTIGQTMHEAHGALFGDSLDAAVDAVKNGKIYHTERYSTKLKKQLDVILYPFTIGDTRTHWSVMIGIDQSKVLSPIREMTVYTIVIGLAAIIIIAVILFFVIGRLINPLSTVSTVMKQVAAGDLTRKVDNRDKNEIGEVARDFDVMTCDMRKLIQEIKSVEGALAASGDELAQSTHATVNVITEITKSIHEIKTKILSQSASVTETTATMGQVRTNIEKLDKLVETQTEQVSQSSAAIEQMIANIKSVVGTLEKNAASVKATDDAMNVGRGSVLEISGDIQEIAKQSSGLLEINAVMENIAEQTNLLSMNAAIEAAHAGDSGKGFAVVADEIRKLSENSSEQSKTIGAVLKRIKESIDKISGGIENTLQKFEAIESGIKTVSDQSENIRHAMEEQNAGSQQILEVITSLNSISQEVKNASTQMLDGSQQVITESEHLQEVTADISDNINQIAAASNKMNDHAARVQGVGDENKAKTIALTQSISKWMI